MLISIRVPLDVLVKISGKTKLKYYEWLKRLPMMTRKNNAAMRESNDDIDDKNVVIIWISFADEAKYFSKSMHKRRQCSNIFDTRVYFGPYFWPLEG